ncbi:MAG: hypothetical protein JRJ49_10595 [Deltaproteobacteria bacterium]|nr:hypothetical protein [Deltaproteobacteria bacterium]
MKMEYLNIIVETNSPEQLLSALLNSKEDKVYISKDSFAKIEKAHRNTIHHRITKSREKKNYNVKEFKGVRGVFIEFNKDTPRGAIASGPKISSGTKK